MRILCCLLSLLVAGRVFAADERRPLTPQDLWAMKRLSAPALSPDGKMAVVSVQEWSVEKNKSTSNLWLVDVVTGQTRRLTTAKASDGSPVFSPEGKRIAFVSKRGEDENSSLYVIPTDGGEAEKLLELPYGVSEPRWLPDGKSLIVATRVIPELAGKLAKEDLAAMKKEIKRRKDSKITAKATDERAFRYWDVWLTDKLAHRLVKVEVATKALIDLTPGFDRLFSFSGEVSYDLSPDGTQVAVSLNSTLPPYTEYPNGDVYLLPTDGSGKLTNLTAENKADDGNPSFLPDGKALVYSRLKVNYGCGESNKLWRHDLVTGVNTPLTEALDYSLSKVEPSEDGGSLWLVAEDKGRSPVFRLAANGTGLTPVFPSGTSSSLRIAGRTVLFLNSNACRPDELFSLDTVTGEVRQLTHFNDELLAKLQLGRVEEYWFEGAAGDKVQGWLFYPADFDVTKTYPLVQLMHGGPHTMVADGWNYRWNAHAFAAQGQLVTWVNRHGSTGFGQAFTQSILNEWGEKPLQDILKSTDYLCAKLPNLDPKRVAAAGGSYGGYMAAWIAGHTDRFVCLINHAGVSDFVTQFGADVTNYSFENVLGGNPWKNAAGMQRNNPMTYASQFKTPMLIIHGELDYRVPYVNGTALYGIYQGMGLPSRLVVFPNENHWILSPQNSLRWYWETQSWFGKYLGTKPTLVEPRFDAPSE